MKILHIMRERNDPVAFKAINESVRERDGEVSVLLMHDSVLSALPEGIDAYACKDDVEARGINVPYPTLDYREIVRLLVQFDSVITW